MGYDIISYGKGTMIMGYFYKLFKPTISAAKSELRIKCNGILPFPPKFKKKKNVKKLLGLYQLKLLYYSISFISTPAICKPLL
jgi:hypothetical protein